jgi:ankyrin repeat protein
VLVLQDGTSPVHLAAWKGHDSVLKLLLLNGGDFRVGPLLPLNSFTLLVAGYLY